MEPADYCRHVEAYLCQRNGGHLVRIVGPAFEHVCAWAAQGIPLSVVCRGIDRHCDRYYAKAGRRRPVRIEFCEADVLDLFEEWRRAVGVAALGGHELSDAEKHRTESLPLHIERSIARLTVVKGGGGGALAEGAEDAVRELDRMLGIARAARGDARERLLARLAAMDSELLEAARREAGEVVLAGLALDADAELAPYKARMPPEAFRQSKDACVDRLIRQRFSLPTLSYV